MVCFRLTLLTYLNQAKIDLILTLKFTLLYRLLFDYLVVFDQLDVNYKGRFKISSGSQDTSKYADDR